MAVGDTAQTYNTIGLECPRCDNKHAKDIMFLQCGQDLDDAAIVAWCPCGSVFVVDPPAPEKGPKEVYSFYRKYAETS